MSELRVPPAVTFAFERYVAEVCQRARLDDYEWPLRARELLTHLQNRWREGESLGLSTTAAEQRALELFGAPKDVAKGLRRPWWKRLLLHQNCRLHRQLTFLAASLGGTMLLGMAHVFLAKEASLDTAQIVGSFSNAFIALGALLAVKWQPVDCPAWLRQLLLIRHGLWFFVLAGLFNVIFNPLFAFRLFLRLEWWLLATPVLAVSCGFGVLGAACFWSEIANLSGRRRQIAQETLAFQMIR